MGEQTTLLWNLQDQGPEAVPLSQVQARIQAGTHRAYEKSTVEQTTATPGLTVEVSPTEAQFRQQTVGADQALTEAAKRSQQAVEDARKGSYDSFSDALDAAADSYVDAMSLGIVDPRSGSTLAAENARMQQEAHPIASKLGTGAAIAVTLLPSGGASAAVGGSKLAKVLATGAKAVEITPLGAAIKAQEAVTQALRAKAISAGTKGGLLLSGATEAAGGAVGGLVMGAGHQVANVLHGRPVSGDAIIDDIGLSTILSGGLGVAGGAFGKAAQKIKNGRQEVLSAAQLDDVISEVHAANSEAAGTLANSHADSARRLKQLNDMAKEGKLDAELTGSDWLKSRNEAQGAVTKAQKQLLKVTGAGDLQGAVTRVGDLLKTGAGKDLERAAVAFGNYQKAVTKFEEAMRPSAVDYEHLLGVNALDELDALTAAETEGSAIKQYEELLISGADEATLNRFAKENDMGEVPVPRNEIGTGKVSPRARAKAVEVAAPKAQAKTPMRDFDVSDVGTEAPGNDLLFQLKGSVKNERGVVQHLPPGETPGQTRETLPGLEALPARVTAKGGLRPTTPNRVSAGVHGPEMPAPEVPGEQFAPGRTEQGLGGSRGKNAMEAHRVLNEAKFAPVPADVSVKIDNIAKKLVESTGGRLGTAEAKELARLMKINTVKVADAGPMAEKIMDVWALKKLAEQAGMGAGKTSTKAANTLAGKAMRAGVVAQARRMLPGGFVGGAAGYAIGGGVGAMLGASGTLAAIAGRMKTGAVLGIAKALNPVGRRFIQFAALQPTKTSYDGSEPTKDFAAKADQLHKLAASPDMLRKTSQDAVADIKAVDPQAYDSAVESSVRRVQNLAMHLPAGTYRGPFAPPGPPDQVDLDNFHTYEAVTFNRDLVFQYIKAGSMPEAVVEAMQEQHPDYLQQVLEYVTTHPDEVRQAPVQSQIALSRLLGINLTQEADPLYIQRQQQGYIKMKEEAEQRKMTQQGASILRGGMPAPLPATPAQQFTTLPSIR